MFYGALGRVGIRAISGTSFSPILLFANGEQGAWYDPSDFLPNWRLNLLTYTEQFDNAAWVASLTGVGTVTKSTTNAGEAPDGTTTADRVIFNLNGGTATTDIALLRQNNATTGDLTFSIAAKSFDGTSSYAMQIIKPDGTAQSITVTGAWQRFSVTGTASGAVNYGLRLRGGQTPTNSDTADVLLWGADLRLTSNASVSPTYQKITDGIQDYLTYQPQPVMFQDSAGTTPVTAVEQPVGLLLDKSKGLALGAELVTNGDFSGGSTGWTLGTGWTISGGVASFSAGAGAELIQTGRNFAANTTYKITFDMTQVSGGGFRFVVDTTGSFVSSYFTTTASHTLVFSVGATSTRLRLGALGGANFSIDNISVRELPGNHASQSTSASRPVLSARVNLLTYSEQFDNAAWTNASPDTPTVTANNLVAPDGTTTGDTLTAATGGIASQARQSINVTGALAYTFSVFIKQGTSTQSRILVRDQTNGLNFLQTTALTWSSGVPVIAPGTGTWATPVSVGNGWWRIAGTGTAGAGASVNVLVSVYPDNSAGTGSLGVWGADLRVTNVGVGLPAYQRVAAATDYDTSGFPLYLKFDGTDDSLATGTIDPGVVDKAQGFMGASALAPRSNNSPVWQFGNTTTTATDAFLRFITGDGSTDSYRATLFGSAGNSSPRVTKVVPYTSVFSTLFDAAETGSGEISVRENATVTAVGSATDSGVTSFGSQVLYIGKQDTAAGYLNGRIYSLILRFSAANLSDAQIASTETYVNNLTKAY